MSIFADWDIKKYTKCEKADNHNFWEKMNKILPLLNIIDSRNDEIQDEVIKRIDQGSTDQSQAMAKIF